MVEGRQGDGGQGRRKTRFTSQGADPRRSTPLASRGRSDVICGRDSRVAQSFETGFAVSRSCKRKGRRDCRS